MPHREFERVNPLTKEAAAGVLSMSSFDGDPLR
jgi:hypothetical protein